MRMSVEKAIENNLTKAEKLLPIMGKVQNEDFEKRLNF